MIAAGLDAASRTGWAVVEAGRGRPTRLASGVVEAHWDQIMDTVAQVFLPRGVELALIEVPYVASNPHTAITLGRIVGRWEEELDRAGIAVELVRAQQWQVGLMAGLIGRTSPRDQRKKAARLWVRQFYGLNLPSEDECDAIGLATWGAQRAAISGRATGARPRPARGGGGAA